MDDQERAEVKKIVEEALGRMLLQDSVETGTPGKNGALKIYFNASNLEDARQRVENGKKVLQAAGGGVQ